MVIVGGLILLAIFVLPNIVSQDLQDSGDTGPSPQTPVSDLSDSLVPNLPTMTREPFIPPSSSSEGQTWLVMLYQDADDKILEQDIYVDLNEAERVGSSDRVHVVAQVDRYKAGYPGDGDWSVARRFYLTRDEDLQRLGSQQVADLGEVNMSDGDTLVDFHLGRRGFSC